jgi:hypothetical protein
VGRRFADSYRMNRRNPGLRAGKEYEQERPYPARVGVYSRAVVSPLWVARLEVSQKTAEKLATRHGLNWQEVHDAIVCVRDLRYGWDNDPVRGLRALVEVEIRGTPCLVVLYPVDGPFGDYYALGSAYLR